jgi:hypothetical protein
MRAAVAMILVPVMKLTGFRFSKSYRREETLYHKIVYRMVDTVGANLRAGL